MKTDCIFYEELRDIGATHKACKFHSDYINKNDCTKCKFKLTVEETKQLVVKKLLDEAKGRE